jgi:hypothetical protein
VCWKDGRGGRVIFRQVTNDCKDDDNQTLNIPNSDIGSGEGTDSDCFGFDSVSKGRVRYLLVVMATSDILPSREGWEEEDEGTMTLMVSANTKLVIF